MWVFATDRIPPLLRTFLSSPALSFGSVLVFCSLLNGVIIFPCYLASLVLTEVGLYLTILTTVWYLGRSLVGLLTFPGSTHRLFRDMEIEFAKYSVRLFDHCLDTTLELVQTIIRLQKKKKTMKMMNGKKSLVTQLEISEKKDIINKILILIRKTFFYKHQVLEIFAGVLTKIYNIKNNNNNHHEPCELTQQSSYMTITNIRETDKKDNFHHDMNPNENESLDQKYNVPIIQVTPQAIIHGKHFLLLLHALLCYLHDLEKYLGYQNKSFNQNHHPILTIDDDDDDDDPTLNLALLVEDMATKIKQHLPLLLPDIFSSSTTTTAAATTTVVESSQEEHHLVGFSIIKDKFNTIYHFIMQHIDPPLHSSIFNMDVQRECFLSRYKNSQQVWIQDPCRDDGQGGIIDAIHIPSSSYESNTHRQSVVYCNPNAGLMELSTGMSFFRGNDEITNKERNQQQQVQNNWVDFYLNQGFDVYLFNYRGYGRSSNKRHRPQLHIHQQSKISKLSHIAYRSFFGFRPSPQSIKDDALTVCRHVIRMNERNTKLHNKNDSAADPVLSMEEGEVKFIYPLQLIIHGESIGGMASAHAARILSSEESKNYEILLICDRTFSNLKAVARRMVGEWTKVLIPYLVPDWYTDVAADYMSAECRKIVAQDTKNDTIIHDMASLKSGIAMAYELCDKKSKSMGRFNQHTYYYKIQEFEQSGLEHLAPKPPIWSIDESLTLQQALHLAACIRRIYLLASSSKTNCSTYYFEEHGVEIGSLTPAREGNKINLIEMVWEQLSSCDGIAGPALGIVTVQGLEWTLLWICSLIVFGAHRIRDIGPSYGSHDFHGRSNKRAEKNLEPIMKLIDALKLVQGDSSSQEFQHEIDYCISSFDYIVARLLNPCEGKAVRERSRKELFTGFYFDLSCGHNCFYSAAEQDNLSGLIKIIWNKS